MHKSKGQQIVEEQPASRFGLFWKKPVKNWALLQTNPAVRCIQLLFRQSLSPTFQA
jgi:hypothetical protein